MLTIVLSSAGRVSVAACAVSAWQKSALDFRRDAGRRYAIGPFLRPSALQSLARYGRPAPVK